MQRDGTTLVNNRCTAMLDSDPYLQATEGSSDGSARKREQRTTVEQVARVPDGKILLVEDNTVMALDAAAALAPC